MTNRRLEKWFSRYPVGTRYKIEITMWAYNDKEPPLVTEYLFRFDDERDAMIILLQEAIEEAERLNNPYDEDGDYRHDRRHFAIDLEGGDDFDAIIRCWDGLTDYMNVTGYKIMEVKE